MPLQKAYVLAMVFPDSRPRLDGLGSRELEQSTSPFASPLWQKPFSHA
jgi:hypothetical protein